MGFQKKYIILILMIFITALLISGCGITDGLSGIGDGLGGMFKGFGP